jgi:hypothetical protein
MQATYVLVESNDLVDGKLAGKDSLQHVVPPPMQDVVAEHLHTVHQIYSRLHFFLKVGLQWTTKISGT